MKLKPLYVRLDTIFIVPDAILAGYVTFMKCFSSLIRISVVTYSSYGTQVSFGGISELNTHKYMEAHEYIQWNFMKGKKRGQEREENK